ncbi:MAG: PKD domain-containing protein, partial [Thermoplasmata archaeon]|nr:PKD domain-containing protein [Thermoplasmata archaeon]
MVIVALVLACTSASASGPVADAGPDLVVIEGEEFILDGSNSTDDVGIVLWTWYIEIDDTSAVIIPNETIATVDLYLSPGLHIITLKVHDADDNEDSDTCSVLVMETDLPLADASDDATTEAGEEHTFDGSGTHSKYPIESYTWTFRYDTSDITLQGVEPSFTFRIPGEFLVTLTVVDTNGSSDMDTVTVTVEDTTLPVPIIEVTKEESSERRKLDGSGSTDNVAIIKCSWVVVFENEITDLSGETVELHRA